MRFAFFGAVVALILGAAGPAGAHPHVWVTARTMMQFDKDGRVTGVRHTWVFDKFYSATALQGLDTDLDGKYSKAELDPLAAVNISSLKDFGYFTVVKAADAEVKLSEPVDYLVEEKAGVVTLAFTLPLSSPIDARLGTLELDVYDPSYYVAFSFAADTPITFAADAPKGCAAKLPQPPKEGNPNDLSESFFSQLGPDSNFGATLSQAARIECAG